MQEIFHDPNSKQCNFYDGRYYHDMEADSWLPGATTILKVWPKQFMEKWLKDVGHDADRIMNEAAEQGSNVHDAVEHYLKGEKISIVRDDGDFNYTKDEWIMINRFREFVKRYKPEILGIETVLADTDVGYGGQIDLVCKINNETYLLDIKTSNQMYSTYDMQLVAYKRLWENKFKGVPIDKCGVLWLKAKVKTERDWQGPGWQVKFVGDVESSLKDFDHAHYIWKRENPNYKPRNLTLPDSINLKEDLK